MEVSVMEEKKPQLANSCYKPDFRWIVIYDDPNSSHTLFLNSSECWSIGVGSAHEYGTVQAANYQKKHAPRPDHFRGEYLHTRRLNKSFMDVNPSGRAPFGWHV